MTKKSEITEAPTIEERLTALELRVSEFERSIITNRTTSLDSHVSSGKPISIKEFINEKKPNSARQITLAIAYFLEHYEKAMPIGVSELEQGFRSAKIPPPKNINDMANKNIAAGFLMESKHKKGLRKAWVLTATGESFVEAGFIRT